MCNKTHWTNVHGGESSRQSSPITDELEGKFTTKFRRTEFHVRQFKYVVSGNYKSFTPWNYHSPFWLQKSVPDGYYYCLSNDHKKQRKDVVLTFLTHYNQDRDMLFTVLLLVMRHGFLTRNKASVNKMALFQFTHKTKKTKWVWAHGKWWWLCFEIERVPYWLGEFKWVNIWSF